MTEYPGVQVDGLGAFRVWAASTAEVQACVDTLERGGVEISSLDAERLRTLPDLMGAFAALYRFDTWSGANLDALEECLVDYFTDERLPVEPPGRCAGPAVLLVRSAERLLADEPRSTVTLFARTMEVVASQVRRPYISPGFVGTACDDLTILLVVEPPSETSHVISRWARRHPRPPATSRYGTARSKSMRCLSTLPTNEAP